MDDQAEGRDGLRGLRCHGSFGQDTPAEVNHATKKTQRSAELSAPCYENVLHNLRDRIRNEVSSLVVTVDLRRLCSVRALTQRCL